MLKQRLAALAILAIAAAAPLQAQTMTFALPDSAVRAQLDRDWWARSELGKEWAYCVTAWDYTRTADGDTIVVAQAIVDAPTTAAGRHSVSYGCNDKQGRELPSIHVHLGMSCSPSRDDIEAAVRRRAPFEMVACGPGITNGYVAAQFARTFVATR